jgi:hypothetical protein
MERIILRASNGMILTNGEIYGYWIALAIGANPNDFYEITVEEYEAIMAAKQAEEEA